MQQKNAKRVLEVVAGLIHSGDHFLACQRPPEKARALLWEFPGGKLEKGESNEACLARELKEELDVEAEIGEFLTENSHGYDFGTVHLSVYRVRSWSGDIKLTVHDDLRWVPLSELADFPNLLPADIPVARALEKILV